MKAIYFFVETGGKNEFIIVIVRINQFDAWSTSI